MGIDSKKLEDGLGTIHAGFPSSLGVGVGGQSCSTFLASTYLRRIQALNMSILVLRGSGQLQRRPSRVGTWM